MGTERAPAGLSTAGRRLWRSITAAYTLRPDELATLESACRTADYVAQLDAELAGAALAAEGSQGQQREHPLLREARLQRALLDRLLARLDLAGADKAERRRPADEASIAGRRAARARWGSGGVA